MLLIIIIRGWYNSPVVASLIVDSVPLHLRKAGKNQGGYLLWLFFW
jgi:hypothetical protein